MWSPATELHLEFTILKTFKVHKKGVNFVFRNVAQVVKSTILKL